MNDFELRLPHLSTTGVMKGTGHGEVGLPTRNYLVTDKDADEREDSGKISRVTDPAIMQNQMMSGQAFAVSVLAWFGKMRGGAAKAPPAPPLLDVSPYL